MLLNELLEKQVSQLVAHHQVKVEVLQLFSEVWVSDNVDLFSIIFYLSLA